MYKRQIDFDVHRLPDSIVLPCYPVLALMLTIAAVVEDHPWALARMALGGLAMWLMYLVMRLAYPKGMGFGDVKLAGVIGGMLGFISWPALLIGAFAGFVLAGVTASIIIGTGLASRKAHIPFGPFMIAGALISVFTSPQISQFYTDLVFRT